VYVKSATEDLVFDRDRHRMVCAALEVLDLCGHLHHDWSCHAWHPNLRVSHIYCSFFVDEARKVELVGVLDLVL